MDFGSVSELAYVNSRSSINADPVRRRRKTLSTSAPPLRDIPDPQPDDDDATPGSSQPSSPHQDHGYAWVVMLGALLGFVSHGAISTTSTLTYQQLLVRFDMTATGAGWITALHGMVRMFSSPCVSLLCYRLSYRVVTFLGGLLYAAGLILMAYAPSPLYVYIAYGVIAAVGSNMYILSSFVVLSQYFVQKRGKAMGVAFCGGGLGTIIFSPLIAMMYDRIGFTSTVMIEAGIVLQMCISAALYRPVPKSPPPMHDPSDDESMQSDSAAKKVSACCLLVFSQLGFTSLRNPVFLYICVLTSSLMGQIFCAYIYTSGLATEVCGLSSTDIAIVLSVGGFCEMPARIMAGSMLDFQLVRPNRLYVFAFFSACSGVIFLSMQFARGLVSLAVLWGIYQAFTLAVHTQHVIIIGEVLPPSDLPAGIGISRVFQGVGLTVGPTVIGLVKDNLGTYTYGYLLIGGIQALLGLLFIPVSCYFYKHRDRLVTGQVASESEV